MSSTVQLLRLQSEAAFEELRDAVKDLDERGSWVRLVPRDDDYLHTDGSILGQVTHVAGCKVLYASAAFKGFEIRLKEITERTIRIGSNWSAALDYLAEAQAYWMGSWNDICDDSLDDLADTNWGEQWPAWKIVDCMIGHDRYHAGQIALIRSVVQPVSEPPPPLTEAELAFLKTFSAW